MKRATILDVAELAGVSIKTVSRVANNELHVSDVTRRKVSEAIERLNYRPDEHARWLGSQRRTPARVAHANDNEPPRRRANTMTDDPMRIDWD